MSTTNYNCPECGKSDAWQIQNRICKAAAYFKPEITHVKCSNCGWTDEAETKITSNNE